MNTVKNAKTGAGQLCGLLLVDKPKRPTSMHVCRIIKRRLINTGFPKSIKVGHGGTLDPLASGLVVVLVGKATRLCDVIMAGEKEYSAAIDLEHFSASCDLETRPEPVEIEKIPARADIDLILKDFVGEISQAPPIYSAMWVGGKRAYEYARKGREVEMVKRPVFIRSIEVTSFQWPRLEIHITCGKGTYIRSLARDIGVALGTGGVLTELRRTRIGTMRIEDSTPLDDVQDPLPVSALQVLSPELLMVIAPKGQCSDDRSGDQRRGNSCGTRVPGDGGVEDDGSDQAVAGDDGDAGLEE